MEQDRGVLYDVSIEVLDLSENAVALLESVAIQSVGDCLDFVDRGADAMIQVPYGLIDAVYDEVIPSLREKGYLDR